MKERVFLISVVSTEVMSVYCAPFIFNRKKRRVNKNIYIFLYLSKIVVLAVIIKKDSLLICLNNLIVYELILFQQDIIAFYFPVSFPD